MKTLKTIALLLLTLIQGLGYSQTNDFEMIVNKHNSSLAEQNKGIAVLVKKENKIETASLGMFKLNEQSVFNIGSATKTFTAILILQEFEKGNLKLTDSIGTYLTPINNVDGSLTIEALLTHESGLDEVVGKNILDIFNAQNDSLYEDNLLNQIEKNDPEMIGKFSYCNTNYLLLGKIIQKVTDKSYFDLLRERIFTPLKMNNTYPYLSKNIPNLATPYHEDKNVLSYLDYRYFANIANSAGSIASTLLDMEIFYTSLFESELLLKKETLKMMMESGNESYGYGLIKSTYNDQKYYGHGGNNIGYAFRNEYNPVTKNLFLVFSNSKSIPSKQTIKNDLLNYLSNKPIETFRSIDIDNFKEYVGTYLLKEANLTLEIVLEGDKMYMESKQQGIKSELTQKNETSLYDTSVGVILTKVDGNTDSLSFNQNGFTTTINKVTPEK